MYLNKQLVLCISSPDNFIPLCSILFRVNDYVHIFASKSRLVIYSALFDLEYTKSNISTMDDAHRMHVLKLMAGQAWANLTNLQTFGEKWRRK